MHIILGIIAAAGAIYFFLIRARTTIEVVDEVADMAQTAIGAARRFGFRRQANKHSVECIEDPKLAVAGLATAYLELDGFPTEEGRQGLLVGLQSTLESSLQDAEEMAVLGHWFVNECQGPDPGISRLARKLQKLAGPQGLLDAMQVISKITGEPSEKQKEALTDIKRIFRV